MVGDTSWHVKPRMGEYILLHKNQGHHANHVIFPCPHPVYGKGVLVQSTLWGNLILGPTARDTMVKDEAGKYVLDEKVRAEPRDKIMGYAAPRAPPPRRARPRARAHFARVYYLQRRLQPRPVQSWVELPCAGTNPSPCAGIC